MSLSRTMRSPTDEVDRQQVLLRLEGARDAERQPLLIRLHDTGGTDGVLRLQGGDQRAVVQAEAGHPLGRELDDDLLVLRAENLDLGDIGHAQQAGTHHLHMVAQLAMGEAIGGEAVDDAEGLAEIIVEAGADMPAGRCRAYPPTRLRTSYHMSGTMAAGWSP
jgi:hypothetical protein